MGSGAASDTAPAAGAPPGEGAATGAAPRAPVQLVGYDNFVRHNPRSDRFTVHRFHHIEFWCADATNTYKR